MKVIKKNQSIMTANGEVVQFPDVTGVEFGEPLHLNNTRWIGDRNTPQDNPTEYCVECPLPNHPERLMTFAASMGWTAQLAGPMEIIVASEPYAQKGDPSVIAYQENGYRKSNGALRFFINDTDDYPWEQKMKAEYDPVSKGWVQVPIDPPTWIDAGLGKVYFTVRRLSDGAGGNNPPLPFYYVGTDFEGDDELFFDVPAPPVVPVDPATPADPTIVFGDQQVAGASAMPVEGGTVVYIPE